MKMWVDLNLRLRRHMTVKTNRLATTDIKTKKKDNFEGSNRKMSNTLHTYDGEENA